MSRITVIGGTGYAGSAIVAQAEGRGHQVTALSRGIPREPVPSVGYVQGDATDAALIIEDLPGTPDNLDWVFVSPALRFGAHAPSEPLGRYELGGEVAVEPETGGVLPVDDYALGLVDLIDNGGHRRTQLNLGNPA